MTLHDGVCYRVSISWLYRFDCRANGQKGQALAEGLVVLLVLLSLWMAITWLARFQDMALQAAHASRFAAFSLTRHPDSRPVSLIRQHYFSGPAHQWADRQGRTILSTDRTEVVLSVDRNIKLSPHAQPGGNPFNSAQLRSGWGIEDTGIASAKIIITPPFTDSARAVPKLAWFSLGWLSSVPVVLSRHTAVLIGAGHASSDAAVQNQVANSAVGWGDAAQKSDSAGRYILSRMDTVDSGWRRPDPQFDWLSLWQGDVPAYHLKKFNDGGK